MIVDKLLELARNILESVKEFDAAGIIELIRNSINSLLAIFTEKE